MTLALTVSPTGSDTGWSKPILIARPPVALSTLGAAKITSPSCGTEAPTGLSRALSPSATREE